MTDDTIDLAAVYRARAESAEAQLARGNKALMLLMEAREILRHVQGCHDCAPSRTSAVLAAIALLGGQE